MIVYIWSISGSSGRILNCQSLTNADTDQLITTNYLALNLTDCRLVWHTHTRITSLLPFQRQVYLHNCASLTIASHSPPWLCALQVILHQSMNHFMCHQFQFHWFFPSLTKNYQLSNSILFSSIRHINVCCQRLIIAYLVLITPIKILPSLTHNVNSN